MNRTSLPWAVGAVMVIIAAIVFSILPQFPAVRGSDPLDLMTPLHYHITMFLAFGIMLTEIAFELAPPFNRRTWFSYGAQLMVISGVSLMRLALFIPVSGHCLVMSYFLLRETISFRGRYRWRMLAGFLITLHILYYKLVVWQDLVTPFTGLLIGGGAWLIGWLTARSEPVAWKAEN